MWSRIMIAPNDSYCWRLGKKEIVLQKRDVQWLYAFDNLDAELTDVMVAEALSAVDEKQWQTAIGEKNNTLQVLPALPDMPLVIRAERKFTVLPGTSAMLFVPIPMYLQFYAGSKKKEHLMFECPTEDLSQTWFGEFNSGILALSWPMDLATTLTVPQERKHYIICPVKLINDSHSTLDVQRLLIHCEYLTVYGKDDDLSTNEVKIKFKGENDVSDVQYASQAPTYLPYKATLNSARTSKMGSVISKSFHFIKSLSSY